MGMRGDIESGVNVELGKNLGRFKTEQLMGLCTLSLPSANVVYSGGKTLHTLKTEDTFNWDTVVNTGQAMLPMGGLPAKVSKVGSVDVWSQIFVAATPACTTLKLDSAYRDVLKNGDVRGAGNTIFKGGHPSMDGHTIVPYNPIDHDGVGPMGSFLNPKAFLGNAVTAHAADGGPHYVIVYNVTGTAAGKWGMYKYTGGNDGTIITTTERLAGANTGTGQNLAKVGEVTWDGALNSSVHPLGSLIIPCNSYGVPYGYSLAFGRAGILRGYGEFRAEHTTDLLNGKFVQDRYLTSVFGQSFRVDRKERVTSVMRIVHAITYPGIKLPARTD
jgi:hypothetical protein